MMNRKWTTILAALVVAGACVRMARAVDGPQWSERKTEAQCIEILKKADADLNDKFAACRQLAVVGKKDAIPVLAALLTDEKLSHMARYGLEPNADPAVDDAFRDALTKTKGRMLAGIVNSIGFRKDAKAVDAVAKLLGDGDPVVAMAAATTLGKIATPQAVAALKQAVGTASADVQPAMQDGLLRAADARLAECKADEALALYDSLTTSSSRQIRIAAFRGAVLASGPKAADKLVAMFQGNDGDQFAVAQRLAIELPGSNVTQALVAAAPKLQGDAQVALLVSLGHRKDVAAVPAVLSAARGGEKNTRVAAFRVLTELGDVAALPVLVPAATNGDADIAKAAQVALAAFPGNQTDAALMPLLDAQEGATQRVGIDLLTKRRAASALPKLVALTRSTDAETRSAAIKAVGELGTSAELSPLIDALLKAKAGETAVAEAALGTICSRAKDRDAGAEQVIAALPKAQGDAKQAMLRVLGTGGGAKALAAVKAAMADADPATADTATRALCDWPSDEAVEDLLTLIKSSQNATYVTLATRGCVRLARDPDLPVARRLELCSKVMASAQKLTDKKLVLGGMGSIVAPEALQAVLSYLDDEKVREEAGLAAITISDKLIRGNPEAVKAAMAKVKDAVKGQGLKNRATALYARAGGTPKSAGAAPR